MTFEEHYYRSMTTKELEYVVNYHEGLDGYIKACQRELDRRNEQTQEFIEL